MTPASDAGEAALRHGVEYNLIGLHRFTERGHELALEGAETIDGVDYRVIRVTLRDGFTTRLYLDPGSWLVGRRRDVRALHPDHDADERPLETVYTSYGWLCGVRRAPRSVQVDLATGDTVQSSRPHPPASALSTSIRFAGRSAMRRMR